MWCLCKWQVPTPLPYGDQNIIRTARVCQARDPRLPVAWESRSVSNNARRKPRPRLENHGILYSSAGVVDFCKLQVLSARIRDREYIWDE